MVITSTGKGARPRRDGHHPGEDRVAQRPHPRACRSRIIVPIRSEPVEVRKVNPPAERRQLMATEKRQGPTARPRGVMATMGDDEWQNVRILEHYAESHISYSLVGVKNRRRQDLLLPGRHRPLHHAEHLVKTQRLSFGGQVHKNRRGAAAVNARLPRERPLSSWRTVQGIPRISASRNSLPLAFQHPSPPRLRVLRSS